MADNIECVDGSREYYDRITDPHELRNLAGTLTPTRLTDLHAVLTGLANCHNGTDCWTAGHAHTNNEDVAEYLARLYGLGDDVRC